MEYEEKATSTNGDTGKGSFLKRLRNIICPYTGIRMIPSQTMSRIESKLAGMKNIREKINYLSRYAPNIPEYCQTYINEIIGCIRKGELRGHENYPEMIRKTLFEESEGRILLDLSDCRHQDQ